MRLRVIKPLQRRVGGAGGGSTSWIFALDTIGVALARQRDLAANVPHNHYGVPGLRFVQHTLAVTQLYADLVTFTSDTSQVESFQTEPLSWWPDGLGSHLKPDAYLLLTLRDVRDHWWAEVDLATESLPTVERKLQRYLDFVRRGQVGPGGVVARVVVSVRGARRRDAIAQLIAKMPAPATELLVAVKDSKTALALLGRLRE